MISAADHLVTAGRVATDALVVQRGLTGMMTHLNAWAIPQGLDESAAVERVDSERERLLDELPPEEIVARARLCIESLSPA
jgi:hypothetical protein